MTLSLCTNRFCVMKDTFLILYSKSCIIKLKIYNKTFTLRIFLYINETFRIILLNFKYERENKKKKHSLFQSKINSS